MPSSFTKISRMLLQVFILGSAVVMFAQQPDSLEVKDNFSGTVSITNNGISLVPSFSLGDPAILFDLKYRRGRFSIEPDLRFSLEAKPWSFLFWVRYKAIENKKFSLRLGTHPGFNFRSFRAVVDSIDTEVIQTRRFLAGELVPSYQLSQDINIGLYYLYSYGLDNTAKHTNFLVANANFSNIGLFEKFFLNVSPQVYYLRQDDIDGIYAVAFFALARSDFPFFLTSTLNKALDTQILPEDDFVWNIALVYRFR